MAEESVELLDRGQATLGYDSERTKTEHDKLEQAFPTLRLSTDDCTISLNVGGQIFVTTLQTLRNDANTMLTSMFSGRFDMTPRRDGSFFIDRDPTHFRFILNFLRTGKIVVPDDPVARKELLLEAEFYNVEAMIEELTPKPEFHESTLLSEKDRSTLMTWLHGKSNWRLIYKASRDGFRAADFHSCCDNYGETVNVIHSTDDYLFGGYTDIPWTSAGGSFQKSGKTFLFAFRSSMKGNKAVKAGVVESSVAVYHHHNACCAFGEGSNIYIADASNTNSSSCSTWNGRYYSLPSDITSSDYCWLVGQSNFQTKDIEVFGHQ